MFIVLGLSAHRLAWQSKEIGNTMCVLVSLWYRSTNLSVVDWIILMRNPGCQLENVP